jgi:TusA-related sulfurtransferase
MIEQQHREMDGRAGLARAVGGARVISQESVSTDAMSSATAFLDALTDRRFDGVEAMLAPEACFRALVPPGPIERRGAPSITQELTQWFGSSQEFEVQEMNTEAVAGRVRIRYRFRLRPHPFVPESGWHIIEQQGYCDVVDGRIAAVDLVCSGFRPEPEEDLGMLHTFDAGTMGCADGLSAEFGRRIKAIAVGDVLTVMARDPAAKEDLPPLARMLGQQVLSVEENEDGSHSITVERVK